MPAHEKPPAALQEPGTEIATAARRRRANGDSTREALLTAAVSLWSERGMAGLTMHGVAERAGKTRGTVYHHFADRAQLVQAAKAHLETALQALFSDEHRSFGDPIDVVVGLAAESPELMRTFFRDMLDQGPRGSVLVQRAMRYFESLGRQGIVRDGVQPDDAALTVLALWFATTMSVSLMNSPRGRRTQARRFKNLFRAIVYGSLLNLDGDATGDSGR